MLLLLDLCRRCAFCWQPTQETSWNHEAYLLFPVHLDGTLLDNAKTMKAKKEFYSTSDVLQIFRQVKRTTLSPFLKGRRIGKCESLLLQTQVLQLMITCLHFNMIWRLVEYVVVKWLRWSIWFDVHCSLF